MLKLSESHWISQCGLAGSPPLDVGYIDPGFDVSPEVGIRTNSRVPENPTFFPIPYCVCVRGAGVLYNR